MAWWTENYPWVLAGIGAMLLVVFRRWVLGRLFSGAWRLPNQRQDAEIGPPEAETATVTRPEAGAMVLRLGFGALAAALVVAGLLNLVALLKDVAVTALPAPLVLAVAGAGAVLWGLGGGLYLLARRAMRRRARQLGVRAGSVASSYMQSLVLAADPAEALAQSRAALLALGRVAALLDGGEQPDGLVGRTGKSARSFGEVITIRVRPSGLRRTAVEIRSRPATWQLFDGGINAENVAAIARALDAARPETHDAAVEEASAQADGPLPTSDWLALAYLAALVGYTGLLIALKEVWPDVFEVWAGWLDSVPLDPLRLLGQPCPAERPLLPQLNLLILPTLLAYGAYNTVAFRQKRERMDLLTWILCLGSLVFLPLLLLMGCAPDWAEGLTSKYRGLVTFMLEHSAGGALYALLLVIFTNGVSYLPALVLARLFGREPKRL